MFFANQYSTKTTNTIQTEKHEANNANLDHRNQED